MFLKFCKILITVILILHQGTSSTEISSDEGDAAGVSENIDQVNIPPLPIVSNHKNLDLLPSTSDCGIYSIKKRIFNGNKTDLFEFPWMALLSYENSDNNNQNFLCAGTIISDRYILTAANCLTARLKLVGVRVGEHNLNADPDCEIEGENISVCADPVQDIEIEDYIPHLNFSKTHLNNDIGLIRLKTPIQFKRSVQPICLPVTNEFKIENFINKRLIITGWGATAFSEGRSSELLKAEVSVVSERECKKSYENTNRVRIIHTHLCAGGPEADTCQGDSGGPIQGVKVVNGDMQYVQFGISSFGRACGISPGVYTRIDYFMDWILDNIKM